MSMLQSLTRASYSSLRRNATVTLINTPCDVGKRKIAGKAGHTCICSLHGGAADADPTGMDKGRGTRNMSMTTRWVVFVSNLFVEKMGDDSTYIIICIYILKEKIHLHLVYACIYDMYVLCFAWMYLLLMSSISRKTGASKCEYYDSPLQKS